MNALRNMISPRTSSAPAADACPNGKLHSKGTTETATFALG